MDRICAASAPVTVSIDAVRLTTVGKHHVIHKTEIRLTQRTASPTENERVTATGNIVLHAPKT